MANSGREVNGNFVCSEGSEWGKGVGWLRLEARLGLVRRLL